jgi:hypothetical protein
MHQPITHLWKENQHIWSRGRWIGQIVCLCAPGAYLVRDVLGQCCFTTDKWLDKDWVKVNYNCSNW